MRYLPMIVAAGLLSAGLLAGSGPANAVPTLAFDRSAVADTLVEKAGYYYRRRYGYRPIAMAIGLITAMATEGPITAMGTDGPIMVMDMGVAGVTEAQPRTPIFNSRVQ